MRLKDFFWVIIALGLMFQGACGVNDSTKPPTEYKEQQPEPHTYYLDSETGSDENSGRSPQKAWKTLKPVNELTLHPADSVLFRTGGVFAGSLKPQGQGAENNPIVFSSYGNGPRPQLTGEEASANTVYLRNISFVEMKNLSISNDHKVSGTRRSGIRVEADDARIAGFKFRNLEIHKIRGTQSLEGYGIKYESFGNNTAGIDGLLVENCEIHDGMFTGVIGGKGSGWRINWARNVVVRNNNMHDLGKNGVRILNSTGALVEFNRIDNTGVNHVESASSVWVFGSDNTTFQFNEFSNAHLNDGNDGTGMHADYNSKNTLFQYNYSHDNKGGAFNVVTNGKWSGLNENPVFRYNLSVNDGGGKKSRTFHIGGTSEGGAIYNNTVYVSLTKDHTFISPNSWNGSPTGMKIYNNIFYVVNNGYNCIAERDHAIRFMIDHNIWYGNFSQILDETTHFTFDPELENPGSYRVKDYLLKANSPAIDQGIVVDGKPDSVDYFGHPLPDDGSVDIGFQEYNGSMSSVAFRGDPVSSSTLKPLKRDKAMFDLLQPVSNSDSQIFRIKARHPGEPMILKLMDVTGRLIWMRQIEKSRDTISIPRKLGRDNKGMHFVVMEKSGLSQSRMVIL